MSDVVDTPELFADLGASEGQVALRKSIARRKASGGSGAKQLKLFTETSKIIRDGSDLDLEPLDATFRDSTKAPLHSWFPYLEGYSPRFVERVRHEYLHDARRIIEPFAGSGTTPIVLGQSGIECAFSEANPAMVFIAETKLAVLRLDELGRATLARNLTSLAGKLSQRVTIASTDEALRVTYTTTFGASVFFDESALDVVLRLRTLNDEISAEDRLLGDCFAVAVLSCLIPSSRLKRAGDLRYRTPKELAAGLPHPIELVSIRLMAQAEDLEQSGALKAEARFTCATAGALHEHLGDDWDGVITSPPYLNGTNYIRNARLELWYLRHLAENADLRRLRDRVITSGINDVHAQTRWKPTIPGVERVVRAIEKNTYDSRIAKMVGGYFHDMAGVFSSLGECLRPGGRLCIDIGDSIYNSVHVPTDDLLVEMAESMGYITVERVHLRKRVSKGGEAVRQQLLVFERPKKLRPTATSESITIKSSQKVAPKGKNASDWRSAWDVFKKTLPHQLMPYSKREWGGPAHSMCSYQGKMKPALAHHLVRCFSAPGDLVLDPFSGAGTIPLEACRMGRRGYGIDISRLGHVLTLAKVAKISPAKMEDLLRNLEAFIKNYRLKSGEIERAAAVRFNSAIPDYFHPETLREVIAARSFFLSCWDSGAEWAVLLSCTLHLLHGNRPYALSRRSHPVTPFKPTGDFEHRELIPRLRDKLARVHDELTNDHREWGGSAQGDCTATWPASIPMADVIITSPPFFDSTRFYMTNWMRFWFAGWEREDFDIRASEFLETRQKQNLDVYHSFYAASRERLRDGGLLILHLGNSAKCDMGAELSKRVAPWFSVADVFTEGVEHCESHGIRDKGTVSGHTYLVLVTN
ncbi:DNA methyltransferase [Burkholderia gladioli]|uniref:DNA methyltransferase n=1 Tax=Burkholderia gladioli TaxID=28095 RepID=UPI00164070CE|nr:DNA methyltransferase [Burkholderia gladioli]